MVLPAMKSPLVTLLMIIVTACACCACSAPAYSVPPVVVTAGPTIFEGSVQGHVLVAGSNASIPGAKVWLINATRDNTTYGATTADGRGHFYFVDILPMGPGAYRLKARKGGDTGTTPPFGVASLENRTVDVYVRMRPASIGIAASRSYVVADGRDHIGITALVNDSMDRPAAAGYPVTFRATGHPAGSLFGSVVPEGAVTDRDGRATAEYGWVAEAGSASHVIIEASAGAGLNASLSIDIRLPDTTPPETFLKASGEPDNVGGFISGVTVALDASDPGGWGVNETFYRLGDSGWVKYNGPFTISGEGGTTVYYYSTDKAGNAEVPGRRTIVIHKK